MLCLLPDGRGWSAWANVAGALNVGRLRWERPEPGSLRLTYEWAIEGRWLAGEHWVLASVDEQGPDSTVVVAGYVVEQDSTVVVPGPFTALRLTEDVEFCRTFGLVRREVTIADDPAFALVPYAP